jgi:preprotein translocase subunit SecE
MASAAKKASQGKRGGKVAPKAGPASWLQKVQSWPGDFSSYVDGLKREMRLVTWPNREQVRATTIVVLATVFVFAIFFGVVDYVLTLAQTSLYETFTQ